MSSASYLVECILSFCKGSEKIGNSCHKTTPCDVLLKTVCRNGFGSLCRFSQIASDSVGLNGRQGWENGFCGRMVSKNGADFR